MRARAPAGPATMPPAHRMASASARSAPGVAALARSVRGPDRRDMRDAQPLSWLPGASPHLIVLANGRVIDPATGLDAVAAPLTADAATAGTAASVAEVGPAANDAARPRLPRRQAGIAAAEAAASSARYGMPATHAAGTPPGARRGTPGRPT